MGHSDYKIDKGPKVYGLAAIGDQYPVHWSSWDMVQRFIRNLNKMESTNAYRLPYEMEWQRACSGGTRLPLMVYLRRVFMNLLISMEIKQLLYYRYVH